MNTTTISTISILAALGTGLGSLNADEPLFEVSAFIAGIEGEGFAGDEDTEVGVSWEFPSWQDGSYYVYDVEDLPIAFEEQHSNPLPLGSATAGLAECSAEVTDAYVDVFAMAYGMGGVQDAGDATQFTRTYAQTHGEFHIMINDDAEVEYDLRSVTSGNTAWAQIYIRKLVNGNFQTVIEHTLFIDNDGELSSLVDTFVAEPGYYQLYFSTYVNTNNNSLSNQHGFHSAAAGLQARLTITEAPSIADITGDGKVDGADLARLLGAWGSSAGGGDLNGDGTVDGADLAILLGEWTE